jgi:hypothetical protein
MVYEVINGYEIDGKNHLFNLSMTPRLPMRSSQLIDDISLVRATTNNDYIFDVVPWSHGSIGVFVRLGFHLTRQEIHEGFPHLVFLLKKLRYEWMIWLS